MIEGLISVRVLTKRGTNKPKGCAFLEYDNPESHKVREKTKNDNTDSTEQRGLTLHHTLIDGRRINVELTVGGGGTYVMWWLKFLLIFDRTDKRKKKLEEKNARVHGMMRRAKENNRKRKDANPSEASKRRKGGKIEKA